MIHLGALTEDDIQFFPTFHCTGCGALLIQNYVDINHVEHGDVWRIHKLLKINRNCNNQLPLGC